MALKFIIHRAQVYEAKDARGRTVAQRGSWSPFRHEIEDLAKALAEHGEVEFVDPMLDAGVYQVPTLPAVLVEHDGRPLYCHEIRSVEQVERSVAGPGGALHPQALAERAKLQADRDRRDATRAKVRAWANEALRKADSGERWSAEDERNFRRMMLCISLDRDQLGIGQDIEKESAHALSPA